MIDISDGLQADLGHLCDISQVGAEIRKEHLPVSVALRREPMLFVDERPTTLADGGPEPTAINAQTTVYAGAVDGTALTAPATLVKTGPADVVLDRIVAKNRRARGRRGGLPAPGYPSARARGRVRGAGRDHGRDRDHRPDRHPRRPQHSALICSPEEPAGEEQ